MEKSVFSEEYGVFLRELRHARAQSGMTQEQVAKAMGQTQSFVSKCERGERRIDIVELARFCAVLGIPLREFVDRIETLCTAWPSRKRSP